MSDVCNNFVKETHAYFYINKSPQYKKQQKNPI